MIKTLLSKIPAKLSGESKVRQEPCRMCGQKQGKIIARVDYWDIKQSDIIECPDCGLMQLDPMLTQEETAKGCLAYYIEETLRVPLKEQERNLIRNFRRGVVFAYMLKKKKIFPKNVLELGPGSGYFSAGLKFVFPQAQITVLDVNQEVLDLNKNNFQYQTIKAIPEEYIEELEHKFDFIIARDIIEHVIDISKVIENVNRYLTEGGYFHFITPNGHEDVWSHYLTFKQKKIPSDLLINHVNYFDGKGLIQFLEKNNFQEIDYYTYKIKTALKGRGWKENERLMAPESRKFNADIYVQEKIREIKNHSFNKNEILGKWFISRNLKPLTYLVSKFHHYKIFKLPPQTKVGHEIFGLFQKVSP
jgi:2-polyprenyl-3-methyl-5-hydroxy-6-metoxy-1,4-benzoquinol methylase